jgi:hypothetical protein
VAVEKAAQHALVALSDLPQQPAARLVDQVVAVGEEVLAAAQRLGELAVADQREGGQDGDATVPDGRRIEQRVEQATRIVTHPVGQHDRRREIDQVPVVDPLAALEVEGGYPLALGVVPALEPKREHDQRRQPMLMDLARE